MGEVKGRKMARSCFIILTAAVRSMEIEHNGPMMISDSDGSRPARSAPIWTLSRSIFKYSGSATQSALMPMAISPPSCEIFGPQVPMNRGISLRTGCWCSSSSPVVEKNSPVKGVASRAITLRITVTASRSICVVLYGFSMPISVFKPPRPTPHTARPPVSSSSAARLVAW